MKCQSIYSSPLCLDPDNHDQTPGFYLLPALELTWQTRQKNISEPNDTRQGTKSFWSTLPNHQIPDSRLSMLHTKTIDAAFHNLTTRCRHLTRQYLSTVGNKCDTKCHMSVHEFIHRHSRLYIDTKVVIIAKLQL